MNILLFFFIKNRKGEQSAPPNALDKIMYIFGNKLDAISQDNCQRNNSKSEDSTCKSELNQEQNLDDDVTTKWFEQAPADKADDES